jgi:hypothetical protein
MPIYFDQTAGTVNSEIYAILLVVGIGQKVDFFMDLNLSNLIQRVDNNSFDLALIRRTCFEYQITANILPNCVSIKI